MFLKKFLLILAYLSRSSICEDKAIMSLLPRALQEYCPGANVCAEKQLIPEENVRNDSQIVSCCTECSCGQNCSDSGNCCFQNNGPQKVGDDKFQKVRSCLYPSTKPPPDNSEYRLIYQSYYMVSSFSNSEFVTNKSCGDEHVAPWGSLYPVYSAQNNQIYKNIKCATNDGVTDGKVFEAIMSCKPLRSGSDVANFVQLLDSIEFHKKCAIDFIVPEIEDIQMFRCFEPLIKSCPKPIKFEIPEAVNLSKENIVMFCESGLVSPFRVKKMYANVFCHICNGEDFTKNDVCHEQIELNNRYNTVDKYGRLAFVGLIDPKFLENRKTTIKQTKSQACDTTSTCRPLLCASGKLRDQAGSCMYLNKIWFDNTFGICINLTLNTSIHVADVLKVGARDVNSMLSRIKSPWPDHWKVHAIYYEVDDDNNNTTSSLLVLIHTTQSKVQPKLFIQNIEKTITQDWVLEHDNNIVVMKAAFASLSLLNVLRIKQISNVVFGNESRKIVNKEYRPVYRNFMHPNINVHITNFYLCEQVELSMSEFILSKDQSVLFNLRTQRYMLYLQFSLIWVAPEEGYGARICVEDSGMIATFSNTSYLQDYYVCA